MSVDVNKAAKVENSKKTQSSVKQRMETGLVILAITVLLFLIDKYFIIGNDPLLSFFQSLTLIIGTILLIPFEYIPYFIFYNNEHIKNDSLEEIVEKLRLRALLLNNLSVIILFTTVFVIFISFYLLTKPPIDSNITKSDEAYLPTSLTVRISASVLLIFLIQILFKVFKYILRVAAFYNARADAIELNRMNLKIELEKLIELFTPEKYDISELQQSSISDTLGNLTSPKYNVGNMYMPPGLPKPEDVK